MKTTKNILVTGASGLVGQALCPLLRSNGHTVQTLSRSSGDYQWDPASGEIDPSALDKVDVVIHLAGESVAQRWTKAAKKRILDSRAQSSELLVREILKRDHPITYISASGINYYGHSQKEPVDEASASGEGFLAEVCRQWEGAAAELIEADIRCVFVRTGVVLSSDGGALAKLLPPFKAGLGGKVGSGEQMMSWIALNDLARIYLFCVEDQSVSGPINAVAPQAVTNLAFTKAIGSAIGRPTAIPLPGFAVKLMFGEMGGETILSDLSVKPTGLKNAGFEWVHENINGALSEILDA